MLKWLFGDDNKRNLKAVRKIADKVVALETTMEALSDYQLKAKTDEFKKRYEGGETLENMLPEAFAVVREAGKRVLSMKHFYVQIMGGIVLFQGRIAQMGTGEGKTLVATLPAYLSAIKGKGVHVVTVNDYLARRDAAWMGKIHRFLGLTVGVVVPGLEFEQKKAAYECDITYATNNELGFDYLRDNMVKYAEEKVQRGLDFAIVDEVDSILIDEARTPLIISGQGDKSSDMYITVNQFAKRLEEGEDFEVDEKRKQATLTEEGAKAAERFFNIENISDIEHTDLNHHISKAIYAHKYTKRDIDYLVEDGEIVIIDNFTGRKMPGRRFNDGLHQAIEAKEGVKVRSESKTLATITFQNFFKLYKKLSGMTGTAKTEEIEFNNIYSLDVVVIPPNIPSQRKDEKDLLFTTPNAKYKHMLEYIKDAHELGQPVLIGTASVEKSEEVSALLKREGIKHNVLNAKNHALEAEIIAQAGKLNAVTIATNMAGRGTDILLGGNPDFLAKSKMRAAGYDEDAIAFADSYQEIDLSKITDEIAREQAQNMINARADYEKWLPEFKKECGAEKKEVLARGGLYIIGTERHESRRIDNQLRGRAGRQGDVGQSIFFLSMEDEMIRLFAGEKLKRMATFMGADEDTVLPTKRMIEMAQKQIEGRNYASRRYVFEYDNVMNKQREIIYRQRNEVLDGKDLHASIVKLIPKYVENVVDDFIDLAEAYDAWDLDALNEEVKRKLLYKPYDFFDLESLEREGIDRKIDQLKEVVIQQYEDKYKHYNEAGFNYTEVERVVMLNVVDDKWMGHIDEMDALKRSIGLMAHAQTDPIKAYGKEGLQMFEEMLGSIRDTVCHMLIKAELERTKIERKQAAQNTRTNIGPNVPEKKTAEVGRNDNCPCGSGKKYKNCCLNKK